MVLHLQDVRRNCTSFLSVSVSAHRLQMQKKQQIGKIVKVSGLGANVMQQKRDLASLAK